MVHSPPDLMTRRSFPDLSAALRARAGRILERWEHAVRHALPTADELTFTQLRDTFPRLLEQTADALAAPLAASPIPTPEPAPGQASNVDIQPGHGRPAETLLASSADHGGTRFHQSFSLNEVLVEYTLLRRMAIEETSAQLGRDLTADESAALNLDVDAAMREGVLAFSAHQTRQLQAANEAQSKYLSFLSHDLRGGLNGIFLMIEVLKRELSSQPQLSETMQDLDLMRRSILETVGTMDRFLHAERFRKGKVKVTPSPVSLTNLLGEIGAQFAYQARDKGIELKVEVPKGCTTVSDRELLSLIFQNLVSNAVKYTTKGGVQIGARPAVADDGGPSGWRVEVTDQGPGIPPERLNDLFDSFTRGLTYGQPGVGLGLTIAHHAAQLLGARLWADSELGRGTTFVVHLPPEPARAPEPEPAKA